ncbi:hypothetical protein [Helicobacter pametensis]|uniref:hypothetical protein n=1 Tax=Helicobacter pametensis TaxID=95149 RepID=UPI0004830121|nr:hypothetical protein [Helicobacter pametensis]
MKSKALAFFAFCALFFCAVGWVIYSLQQPIRFSLFDPPTSKVEDRESKKDEKWVETLSEQTQQNYTYPANEMVLNYNFDRGVEPLRVFINDLSEYRFYCINQILLESKVEYAYYKTNEVIQLVIFLNNKEMQDKILEDFDYYKVKYSLYSSK